MKNKRGATPPSVLLLVLMALVLSAAALVVFNMKDENLGTRVSDIRIIEEAYAKEAQIDFMVGQGVSLEEAVEVVDGAKLRGDEVVIEVKKGAVIVFHTFKPATPE